MDRKKSDDNAKSGGRQGITSAYETIRRLVEEEGQQNILDIVYRFAARNSASVLEQASPTAGNSSNLTSPFESAPSKPESSEAESPEAESPEAESPEAESPEAESPEPESPEPESPEPESPEPESPEQESPEPESPEAESPAPESPEAESPAPESSEPGPPSLMTLSEFESHPECVPPHVEKSMPSYHIRLLPAPGDEDVGITTCSTEGNDGALCVCLRKPKHLKKKKKKRKKLDMDDERGQTHRYKCWVKVKKLTDIELRQAGICSLPWDSEGEQGMSVPFEMRAEKVSASPQPGGLAKGTDQPPGKNSMSEGGGDVIARRNDALSPSQGCSSPNASLRKKPRRLSPQKSSTGISKENMPPAIVNLSRLPLGCSSSVKLGETVFRTEDGALEGEKQRAMLVDVKKTEERRSTSESSWPILQYKAGPVLGEMKEDEAVHRLKEVAERRDVHRKKSREDVSVDENSEKEDLPNRKVRSKTGSKSSKPGPKSSKRRTSATDESDHPKEMDGEVPETNSVLPKKDSKRRKSGSSDGKISEVSRKEAKDPVSSRREVQDSNASRNEAKVSGSDRREERNFEAGRKGGHDTINERSGVKDSEASRREAKDSGSDRREERNFEAGRKGGHDTVNERSGVKDSEASRREAKDSESSRREAKDSESSRSEVKHFEASRKIGNDASSSKTGRVTGDKKLGSASKKVNRVTSSAIVSKSKEEPNASKAKDSQSSKQTQLGKNLSSKMQKGKSTSGEKSILARILPVPVPTKSADMNKNNLLKSNNCMNVGIVRQEPPKHIKIKKKCETATDVSIRKTECPSSQADQRGDIELSTQQDQTDSAIHFRDDKNKTLTLNLTACDVNVTAVMCDTEKLEYSKEGSEVARIKAITVGSGPSRTVIDTQPIRRNILHLSSDDETNTRISKIYQSRRKLKDGENPSISTLNHHDSTTETSVYRAKVQFSSQEKKHYLHGRDDFHPERNLERLVNPQDDSRNTTRIDAVVNSRVQEPKLNVDPDSFKRQLFLNKGQDFSSNVEHSKMLKTPSGCDSYGSVSTYSSNKDSEMVTGSLIPSSSLMLSPVANSSHSLPSPTATLKNLMPTTSTASSSRSSRPVPVGSISKSIPPLTKNSPSSIFPPANITTSSSMPAPTKSSTNNSMPPPDPSFKMPKVVAPAKSASIASRNQSRRSACSGSDDFLRQMVTGKSQDFYSQIYVDSNDPLDFEEDTVDDSAISICYDPTSDAILRDELNVEEEVIHDGNDISSEERSLSPFSDGLEDLDCDHEIQVEGEVEGTEDLFLDSSENGSEDDSLEEDAAAELQGSLSEGEIVDSMEEEMEEEGVEQSWADNTPQTEAMQSSAFSKPVEIIAKRKDAESETVRTAQREAETLNKRKRLSSSGEESRVLVMCTPSPAKIPRIETPRKNCGSETPRKKSSPQRSLPEQMLGPTLRSCTTPKRDTEGAQLGGGCRLGSPSWSRSVIKSSPTQLLQDGRNLEPVSRISTPEGNVEFLLPVDEESATPRRVLSFDQPADFGGGGEGEGKTSTSRRSGESGSSLDRSPSINTVVSQVVVPDSYIDSYRTSIRSQKASVFTPPSPKDCQPSTCRGAGYYQPNVSNNSGQFSREDGSHNSPPAMEAPKRAAFQSLQSLNRSLPIPRMDYSPTSPTPRENLNLTYRLDLNSPAPDDPHKLKSLRTSNLTVPLLREESDRTTPEDTNRTGIIRAAPTPQEGFNRSEPSSQEGSSRSLSMLSERSNLSTRWEVNNGASKPHGRLNHPVQLSLDDFGRTAARRPESSNCSQCLPLVHDDKVRNSLTMKSHKYLRKYCPKSLLTGYNGYRCDCGAGEYHMKEPFKTENEENNLGEEHHEVVWDLFLWSMLYEHWFKKEFELFIKYFMSLYPSPTVKMYFQRIVEELYTSDRLDLENERYWRTLIRTYREKMQMQTSTLFERLLRHLVPDLCVDDQKSKVFLTLFQLVSRIFPNTHKWILVKDVAYDFGLPMYIVRSILMDYCAPAANTSTIPDFAKWIYQRGDLDEFTEADIKNLKDALFGMRVSPFVRNLEMKLSHLEDSRMSGRRARAVSANRSNQPQGERTYPATHSPSTSGCSSQFASCSTIQGESVQRRSTCEDHRVSSFQGRLVLPETTVPGVPGLSAVWDDRQVHVPQRSFNHEIERPPSPRTPVSPPAMWVDRHATMPERRLSRSSNQDRDRPLQTPVDLPSNSTLRVDGLPMVPERRLSRSSSYEDEVCSQERRESPLCAASAEDDNRAHERRLTTEDRPIPTEESLQSPQQAFNYNDNKQVSDQERVYSHTESSRDGRPDSVQKSMVSPLKSPMTGHATVDHADEDRSREEESSDKKEVKEDGEEDVGEAVIEKLARKKGPKEKGMGKRAVARKKPKLGSNLTDLDIRILVMNNKFGAAASKILELYQSPESGEIISEHLFEGISKNDNRQKVAEGLLLAFCAKNMRDGTPLLHYPPVFNIMKELLTWNFIEQLEAHDREAAWNIYWSALKKNIDLIPLLPEKSEWSKYQVYVVILELYVMFGRTNAGQYIIDNLQILYEGQFSADEMNSILLRVKDLFRDCVVVDSSLNLLKRFESDSRLEAGRRIASTLWNELNGFSGLFILMLLKRGENSQAFDLYSWSTTKKVNLNQNTVRCLINALPDRSARVRLIANETEYLTAQVEIPNERHFFEYKDYWTEVEIQLCFEHYLRRFIEKTDEVPQYGVSLRKKTGTIVPEPLDEEREYSVDSIRMICDNIDDRVSTVLKTRFNPSFDVKKIGSVMNISKEQIKEFKRVNRIGGALSVTGRFRKRLPEPSLPSGRPRGQLHNATVNSWPGSIASRNPSSTYPRSAARGHSDTAIGDSVVYIRNSRYGEERSILPPNPLSAAGPFSVARRSTSRSRSYDTNGNVPFGSAQMRQNDPSRGFWRSGSFNSSSSRGSRPAFSSDCSDDVSDRHAQYANNFYEAQPDSMRYVRPRWNDSYEANPLPPTLMSLRVGDADMSVNNFVWDCNFSENFSNGRGRGRVRRGEYSARVGRVQQNSYGMYHFGDHRPELRRK